jgi:two-component system OmpR family sensor kinase
MAFFAITLSFVFFIQIDKDRFLISQQQRYDIIADSFLNAFTKMPSSEDITILAKQFKVEHIQSRKAKLDIINHSHLLFFKDTYLGRIRIYQQDHNFYLYVQQRSYNIMLKDLKSKPYNFQIALSIYIIFILIFFGLYILLRKKLFPLKKLHRQIEKFSSGNLDIDIQVQSNDEIGKIAQSFSNAIAFIKNQSQSKNLFMRNMMHELRTPITKGMIIAETIDSVKDKKILQNAFERMNNIIKELSTVEKISSNLLTLHKEKLSFQSVYESTLKIMLLEKLPIKTQFDSFDLYVDKELFSIVLKNLLDNAVKFNTHNEVLAIANTKHIQIISHGKALSQSLEFYTEPFSQEEKRSDGFGLGLYIVKTILDLHKMQLHYEHQEGKNIFTVVV